MDRWIRVAAVMLPALLSAVLAIAVNVPRSLRESVAAWLHNQRLELAREIIVHAGFYGTIASALLGVPAHSGFGVTTICVWATLAFWVASAITSKLHERERAQELQQARDSHRRMAGTVRSIVREELERARRSGAGEAPANTGAAQAAPQAAPGKPPTLETGQGQAHNQSSCVKDGSCTTNTSPARP